MSADDGIGAGSGGTPGHEPRTAEADTTAEHATAAEHAAAAGGAPVCEGQGSCGTGPRPAPAPDTAAAPSPAAPSPAASASSPPVGLAALSFPFRLVGALALAAVLVLTCLHLSLLFLHVAPANSVGKRQAKTVNAWIYPEFEQNWKLFAPDPIQQDTAVQARASGRHADGTSFTTGWYDLSARDGAALHGALLPSHAQQNTLRRAWSFYTSSHDDEEHALGKRGALSAAYLTRLATQRLERAGAGGPGAELLRVRVRARITLVPPPPWSGEKLRARPAYRTLDWAKAHR